MSNLFLYLMVAVFAWMGFALFGGDAGTSLTTGFLLLMACLSVLIWDRFVAPLQRRAEAKRNPVRPEATYGAMPGYRPEPGQRPTRGTAPRPAYPASQGHGTPTYRPADWRPISA